MTAIYTPIAMDDDYTEQELLEIAEEQRELRAQSRKDSIFGEAE